MYRFLIMCIITFPAFILFVLAEGAGVPGLRHSAVRLLSAQQYQQEHHLPVIGRSAQPGLSWRGTVRPPFSWDYPPAETRNPEEISLSSIPVKESSYFANRQGNDQPENLVLFRHKDLNINNPQPLQYKSNTSEARGSEVIRRKSKKKKVKKPKIKNWRNGIKLASNCTETAKDQAHTKLCEAQRRQINKQRSQRRKKKRHMKERRKERQRKKQKEKEKSEKLPDMKLPSENISEKSFSSEPSDNRFVLNSTSNGSGGIAEKTPGNEPSKNNSMLERSIEKSSTVSGATMGNELLDPSAPRDAVMNFNVSTSDRQHHETTSDQKNTTFEDAGSDPKRTLGIVPRWSSASTTDSPEIGPRADAGRPEAGGLSSTEPTTDGRGLASGVPTTSSPLAAGGSNTSGDAFSRHNRVDVSGPLLGSEKGDLSCITGRFLPAPAVNHADVKYIRSGEGADGTLVARYECRPGYRLEHAAAYRLWCSLRAWLGEAPRCVPSDEELDVLDASMHCAECDHVCQRPGQSVLCSCYRGFQAQNTTCHDINECSVENGGCEHECVNTAGSFFCKCPQGFRVNIDGKTCRDINECLLRNGHGPCQDTCSNLHGGYSCSCDGIPGTRLSSDNHTCEDVDECAAGTAGCSHTCLNTLGRVFCLCPAGYELGSDWKTCQDVDECRDPQLQEGEVCGAECVNTVGSYHCRSPGDQPVQECSGPGNCGSDVSGALLTPATCPPGLAPGADLLCKDVDECSEANGGCSHRCVNTRGGFHCRCKAGFALDADGRSCIEAAAAEVCPPLDTPPHGYLQCERQPIRARRRVRVVNHAGTVCRLHCPLGSRLRGSYRRTCSTAGVWTGPQDGVCLRFMVPAIKCPENITAQLPPGRRTVHVVFERPITSVDWFRHVIAEPMWGKRLEGDLPAGSWVVTFTARHPVSHLAASCALGVTVSGWRRRSEDPAPRR
ncbi:uncharacterized protein LOC134534261 isoform X2 [Bacillus rossius redtenbacheri]|uniref:uncharacterized protein LOC134534261 isoform X2 n=1 Tax=Bacillus rossius redtenbacheri TaxID=93214 RepID=UPI002FDEE940